MSSKNQTFIIIDAPYGCRVSDVWQQIGSLLPNGKDAIKRIKVSKTSTDEIIPGKFEIELELPEGK